MPAQTITPEQLSVIIKGGRKSSVIKNRLKEFISTKPTLCSILEKMLKT